MKKQIISLSIAAAVAVGFTGCMGGGSLTTPVKERSQDVQSKAMTQVGENASKELNVKLQQSKYQSQNSTTLGQLKSSNQKLYNLVLPIAKEAQKMYVERELPEDITKAGAQWLLGDVNSLNITTATTQSGKFNGRFYPFNNLLLINFSDKVDTNLAKFLIAHEFAHAIALHVSEEKTIQLKAMEGAEATANVALDVALNEAYMNLQKKEKRAAQLMDLAVKEKVFKMFFTEKDLKTEEKIVAKRKDGFAAKAAIKAKQADKLNKLGIDLAIPTKTKMVLKHLVSSGLDAAGAIDALKGRVDFASANAITITGHPKEQEMEADSIALELTKRMGIQTQASACKRFAGNKQTGIFDAHPSYSDRRSNLGCAK